MQHRTITLANGALGCTCGEEHGPSLREELDWALGEVVRLRALLEQTRGERDEKDRQLRMALRRIAHVRRTAPAA